MHVNRLREHQDGALGSTQKLSCHRGGGRDSLSWVSVVRRSPGLGSGGLDEMFVHRHVEAVADQGNSF